MIYNIKNPPFYIITNNCIFTCSLTQLHRNERDPGHTIIADNQLAIDLERMSVNWIVITRSYQAVGLIREQVQQNPHVRSHLTYILSQSNVLTRTKSPFAPCALSRASHD
jgi:hypothetical protein